MGYYRQNQPVTQHILLNMVSQEKMFSISSLVPSQARGTIIDITLRASRASREAPQIGRTSGNQSTSRQDTRTPGYQAKEQPLFLVF
ncbi:hypothetical protein AMJ74_03075 [candidate division WOR_3 bacterium SM1_77]|uniref:Uncharacterized protein n=1 Tax=candidate division WOR_3 bacterium SM1_77 TaxID=1703778 RepID=A0A0S8JXQ6_UNCW3|nr:MAG: hypothetical protein AMJ74_03075 [candidate division WOR_3 bacterium SM1_77]